MKSDNDTTGYPAGTEVLAIAGRYLGRQYTILKGFAFVYQSGEEFIGPDGHAYYAAKSDYDGLACQIVRRLKRGENGQSRLLVYPVSWLVPIGHDPDEGKEEPVDLKKDVWMET